MYHHPHSTNLASVLLEIQVTLSWHPRSSTDGAVFGLMNTVCFALMLPRVYHPMSMTQKFLKYQIPSSKVATDTMADDETSYKQLLVTMPTVAATLVTQIK